MVQARATHYTMNILKTLCPDWFTELGTDCNAHFFRFVPPVYQFDNKPIRTKLDSLEDSHELSKLFGSRSVWDTVNYNSYPKKDADGFVKFDDLPGWSTPSPEATSIFLETELSILRLDELKTLQVSFPSNPVWKKTVEYGRLGLGCMTRGILVWGILHLLKISPEDAHLCAENFSAPLSFDNSPAKMIRCLNADAVVSAT